MPEIPIFINQVIIIIFLNISGIFISERDKNYKCLDWVMSDSGFSIRVTTINYNPVLEGYGA